MHIKYYVLTFSMCFFVWIILVDNMLIPSKDSLKIDSGTYSRYRIKKWSGGGRLNFIKDEIMVYAHIKGREQIYYIDYQTYFENTLKNMPAGTPIQMRYINSFPKLWKRHLYDMRSNNRSVVTYSPNYLKEKQKQIWKISGILGGIYLVLVILGVVSKPRGR